MSWQRPLKQRRPLTSTSRAKHGMYIIGNAATSSHIPMWAQVIGMLKQTGNFGESLPLCCPQHPDTVIEVSTPEDFLIKAPEGGCSLKCNLRLECGHACTFKCHSRIRHDAVICQQPCERRHTECDHACPKQCGTDCGPCPMPVRNVGLSCGHSKRQLPCYMTQQLDLVKCDEQIEVVGKCGHASRVRCGTDPSDPNFSCMATCDSFLPCGHGCRKPCLFCRKVKEDETVSTNHGLCINPCGRDFTTCSHSCTAKCHGEKPCPLCAMPCPIKCSHSTCGKQCHEPCAPCVLDCQAGCSHQGYCKMPCAIPCDIVPCSRRCDESLECGHQCPSVCGEKCPTPIHCQICAEPEVTGAVVDYIENLTYAQINLDESPCIVPLCGHVMTVESMDGHMDLAAHYTLSGNGNPLAPRGCSSEPLSVAVKGCPICRGPLRNINRYNRAVKRALLDESTKKFIVWSNMHFVQLATALNDEEEAINDAKEINFSPDQQQTSLESRLLITGVRDSQLAEIRGLSGLDYRLGSILGLRKRISQFLHKVKAEEQPFARIAAMTVEVGRKTGITPTFTVDTGVLQTRAQLLTMSLLLRCDYDILSDLLNILKHHEPRMASTHPWLKKQLCFDLSKNRRDCLELVRKATQKQQPMVVIEARLHFAKFVALERMAPANSDAITTIVASGRYQVEMARTEVDKYASTASMMTEIQEVEKMLREETFYTAVTSAEKQAVYQAMAQDFRGTGHWYYCENMHPVRLIALRLRARPLLTLLVVHRRRMWNAYGDFPMPSMRRIRWRPVPSISCRCHSCGRY